MTTGRINQVSIAHGRRNPREGIPGPGVSGSPKVAVSFRTIDITVGKLSYRFFSDNTGLARRYQAQSRNDTPAALEAEAQVNTESHPNASAKGQGTRASLRWFVSNVSQRLDSTAQPK